jgi:hypothetical protein
LRRESKSRWLRLIGLVALLAIVAGSWILTPSFGTSFLTRGDAKELFYKKARSDRRYLSRSGQTRIVQSPRLWSDRSGSGLETVEGLIHAG